MMDSKRLFWQKKEDRDVLVELLLEDEIAICSTDTLYGFLGKTSESVYHKILELKQIEKSRPFIVLIDSINKLDNFIDREKVSNRILEFLSLLWPGPVTVIFEAQQNLPEFLTSEGKVALRCPDHVGLLTVLTSFDGLFSTSANRAADPAPQREAEINKELLRKVACFVTDEPGVCLRESQPSTIIEVSRYDVSGDGYKIVRHGACSEKKLRELYEKATKLSA
ncbi:L-threonylcarbamoyladenylate synthase [Candidatus Babeliales bacterium]|nr:L-threonylcarbamoyladenylate synthase [Candidatus Babeliales bacterium]